MVPINLIMDPEQRPERAVQKALATELATRKFKHAYTRSWIYRIWAALTHRSSRILDLKRIKATISVHSRHYEGLRTVPIDQIRGSENRYKDFDIHFNPIRLYNKSRWVNIATAIVQGAPLPPVELIKVGDTYFVRDGHHRVSAARALGQKEIEAIVTTWKCE